MAISAQVASLLYGEIEPYSSEVLEVAAPHRLHVEQCGNPDGIPILFVHGGPGAGCSEADRRFFDPELFRVVLMDQRGSGRSTPHGELEGNSTAELVADFELLREHLGIERWHVFGGSWGSTLGLHYAQVHPERVLSLTLRGIWLFRDVDVRWWLYGMRHIQPERWRVFAGHVPAERRDDLLEAYHELFTGSDREVALEAARVWSVYEGSSCTLLPNADFAADFAEPELAWNLARLEAHYLKTQRFQPDDRLTAEVDRVRHIPTFMVHGRYDIVCPVEGADHLHRAWPESELVIVEDAGHASREPGTARELVAACDRIAAMGDPRRAHLK